MDKKKKISKLKALALATLFALTSAAYAQDVKEIQFCDKKYLPDNDSITLFLKVLNSHNQSADVDTTILKQRLTITEDGTPIPREKYEICPLTSGQRIPANYTFSVLVDLSIPENGKGQIYDALKNLVESAHDSCVYLSFFGDKVGQSLLATKQNYPDLKEQFLFTANEKCFYSALYAKIAEFNWLNSPLEDIIDTEDNYTKIDAISVKAKENIDKNILFVFTEGNTLPKIEQISYHEVTEYQNDASRVVPKIYALFYDAGNGIDDMVELTLRGVTNPNIADRQGAFMPSNDIHSIIENFEQAVKNEMYDFAFTYQVPEDKTYKGKVQYEALWDEESYGFGAFSIGTEEQVWPKREQKANDWIVKYLIALLITLLTILFFIIVTKVIIPGIKSLTFSLKHYKKYKPEANVQKRVCHYCRREIMPGDPVVTKCKHIMHLECWKENGYKCSEYGQNCKEGIQEHVHWRDVFSLSSLRDCYQTIAGILAGLVSWIIYNLLGDGAFGGLSRAIVNTFYNKDELLNGLTTECTAKVSSFLTIGLLLAFFLSLIFRYFDGVRKKDWKSLLKTFGWSLVSGLIGMAAFAVGAIILCLLLSPEDTYIHWAYSIPAYLLFSVCASLSLTIKSTIPAKSALIGGLISAVIGFIVLYFSNITSARRGWTNMLLDFVIYGGGLGASLVTVRMLAEKYYLVIKNGVKEGQRIPIHKWMNATGGGNKVTIGMTERCEIQMTWEKSNKVAKEHVQLYVDHTRSQAMLKPMATKVIYNSRAELPVNKPVGLSNNDTFTVGDTIFQYVEN
jgi:hypothetical protein